MKESQPSHGAQEIPERESSRKLLSAGAGSEDFVCQTQDGFTLRGRLFRPSTEPHLPPFVLLPAMGAKARSYQRAAQALASHGHLALTIDLRGTDRSTPAPKRGLDWGFDEHLRSDLPAVLEQLSKTEAAPPILLGHSYGGHLALAFSSLKLAPTQGVVLAASANMARKHWGFMNPGILAFSQGFAWIARSLGYLPGHRIGWGCPIARQVVIDWAGWCSSNRFRGTDGTDFEPSIARLGQPLLAVSFSDDRVLGRKSAADALASLCVDPSPERWHFSPTDLGKRNIGHFGFLRDCPRLWQEISNWAARNQGGAEAPSNCPGPATNS